ncbi:cation transporting ATPase C-terminal domain-containing protein, partial [Acinetobacter baumannii]
MFDYATFFILLYGFQGWNHPQLFHTGWLVESLLTQTLIIHVIRTDKIPFVQSTASPALLVSSLIIASIAVWLPYSPLAIPLGLVRL